MQSTRFTAILNLHGKVYGKPCRNVEKRVLHRWNLVELPLQATVSSYLSEKENAMRVIRRNREQRAESSNPVQRERPTIPKRQNNELQKQTSTPVAPKTERPERPTTTKLSRQEQHEQEKPSAPQNRPRSERIEPTPRQREDRPTVKDKPQTTVADRKPDRPAERPMVPDKPKTRYTMPKGLDEETFGAEFKQRKTRKITRKQRRSESRGERK